MLIVGYEGKRLFICASYVRTFVLCRLQEFHVVTPLLSPSFFVLSISSRVSRLQTSLIFFDVRRSLPRVVKPDFLQTDIFFESFCVDRKNGDSEHREAENGGEKKKGRKSGRTTGGTVKRAMRVLNDLRGPQLVELFVLPVRRIATGDTRERSG